MGILTGFLQSDIVEGKLGVAKTFVVMDSNVSRSTSGNRIMGAAGCVRASVGVGGDVCDEEGESEDRQRERETHL